MGMRIESVWAVYFSGTGTTKKITEQIADRVAKKLSAARRDYDFSLPPAREKTLQFTETDLAIIGVPVYAGRVPNLLLPFLNTICGAGGPAIPVVLFGNRNYDDALIELRDILEKAGFCTIAAAAFVGEHSFSDILAKGRPDEKDMETAKRFARHCAKKILELPFHAAPTPIPVEGIPYPYRGYYQPQDRQGNAIDIRKVKPVTSEACDGCGICAGVCTMGSISPQNPREVTGVCTKCCACVKSCPISAKRFEDANYLYHQHELEEGYVRRAEPALFV